LHLLAEGPTAVRYLPKDLGDAPVLVGEAEGVWRAADGGCSEARAGGLAYRRSKDVDNSDGNRVLPWGTLIAGIDEGDGWVRCTFEQLPDDDASLDGLDLLLAQGFEIDAEAQDGCTPLHVAAREGATEFASALVSAGAVLDRRRGGTGETALQFAQRYDRSDTAARLQSLGARDPAAGWRCPVPSGRRHRRGGLGVAA